MLSITTSSTIAKPDRITGSDREGEWLRRYIEFAKEN
jgi:hypothetical protein